MSRKFKIKNVGEKKFKFENLKYYNLIKKVYDRFDGEDYTKSSMGVDYIFYNTLIKLILEHKPKFILELGSGYTTYLMGTLIQDYNLDTKLLSLENDKKWYDWIKNEKLDVLNSVVMSDIKSWERDGEIFVKYTYDYDMDEVDFVLLDGPGYFEYDGLIRKNSIQYNYYELISYKNLPVDVLIDGRELTKKFYESEFKKRGWSDTHIKFQEITWMIEDGEGGINLYE
jgi:hypothetical protein|tara:strand:+ start:1212 stop:1892 length:681 start_codon:yes stop_codon:yes gene_type:complete